MLRIHRILPFLCVVGLSIVLSCGAPSETCESDAQCQNGLRCDLETSLCVVRSDNGGGGGGDSLPTGNCKIEPFSSSNVKANGGQSVTLDDADRSFFETLYKIYYISKNCHAEVWGGKYQMHKVPTYVVNIGKGSPGTKAGIRGFLINHPNPPQGSVLVDAKLVYGIQDVYLYNDAAKRIESPGFEFAFQVGSAKVYAFEYGSGEQNNPIKDSSTFGLFVHEGFHRVQDHEESWQYPDGNQDTSGYPLTPEMTALLLLEDAALYDGVTGGSSPNDALQVYYAARKERIRLDTSANKLVKSLDNFQEWLEGTAMYAEQKYMNLLGLGAKNSNPNSIAGRIKFFGTLGAKESKLDIIDSIGARYYGSGAGVGLLLDKLGDKEWKSKIRKGKTPYDILNSRFSNLSSAKLKEILDQAKKKYDYDAKLLPRAKDYASRK